ncbi:MAG: GTP-binding protein [Coxiellaceae bacterium]|nr:GTP-binding protein [Coxiellaceae bacterium]
MEHNLLEHSGISSIFKDILLPYFCQDPATIGNLAQTCRFFNQAIPNKVKANAKRQHLLNNFYGQLQLLSELGIEKQLIKCVMVGDSNTHKTELQTTFCRTDFDLEQRSTIGIDFRTKTYTTKNGSITLQIWNTAGQERYRGITEAYYRDAHVVFIVVDLVQDLQLNTLRSWHNAVLNSAPNATRVVLLNSSLHKGITIAPQEAIRHIRTQLNEDIPCFAVDSSEPTNSMNEKALLTSVSLALKKQILAMEEQQTDVSNDDHAPVANESKCIMM